MPTKEEEQQQQLQKEQQEEEQQRQQTWGDQATTIPPPPPPDPIPPNYLMFNLVPLQFLSSSSEDEFLSTQASHKPTFKYNDIIYLNRLQYDLFLEDRIINRFLRSFIIENNVYFSFSNSVKDYLPDSDFPVFNLSFQFNLDEFLIYNCNYF